MEERLKVLIVDDEPIARKFLRVCIDWEAAGFTISAEAGGGAEALDLMEVDTPDIVFADIQMPFMDGLTFSRIVAKQYPQVKIVILTAHQNFTYAKESVGIGVQDFLLKPINRDEVQTLVAHLREAILAEKQHWREFGALKQKVQENQEYLKEKLLTELLTRSYDVRNLTQKLRIFYPDGIPEQFQAAIFEPSDSRESEETKLLLRMKMAELIRSRLPQDVSCEVFLDNRYAVILLNHSAETEFAQLCEQMQTLLSAKLDIPISGGIGGCYVGAALMSRTYREANDALKYGQIFTPNQVVPYSNEMVVQKTAWQIDEALLSQLSFCVKAGLDEKAIHAARELLDGGRGAQIALQRYRMLAIDIVTNAFNAAADIGLDYESFYSDAKPYITLTSLPSQDEIDERVFHTIKKIADQIRLKRTQQSQKSFSEIEQYIRENYADPELSLTSVAEQFYFNPSYLSRIFKKQTGQHFSEFLYQIRMKKAVELACETEQKSYQIASAVGIKDANYFSICFKKFTGKTISEYRKETVFRRRCKKRSGSA